MTLYAPDLGFSIAGQLPAVEPTRTPCDKCKGTGRFFGYSGRDVGECFACKGRGFHTPRPEAKTLDTSALFAAFDKARAAGLKRPKMRFNGFACSLAPLTGKNPGAIYVKADDETYLGKIAGDRFFASRDCGSALADDVASAMSDPLAAAIAYGRRSGACAICGKELTVEKSVERGIGPKCAAKFGLMDAPARAAKAPRAIPAPQAPAAAQAAPAALEIEASQLTFSPDGLTWSADMSDLGILAGMPCPDVIRVIPPREGFKVGGINFAKQGHDEHGTCHYLHASSGVTLKLWND